MRVRVRVKGPIANPTWSLNTRSTKYCTGYRWCDRVRMRVRVRVKGPIANPTWSIKTRSTKQSMVGRVNVIRVTYKVSQYTIDNVT